MFAPSVPSASYLPIAQHARSTAARTATRNYMRSTCNTDNNKKAHVGFVQPPTWAFHWLFFIIHPLFSAVKRSFLLFLSSRVLRPLPVVVFLVSLWQGPLPCWYCRYSMGLLFSLLGTLLCFSASSHLLRFHPPGGSLSGTPRRTLAGCAHFARAWPEEI